MTSKRKTGCLAIFAVVLLLFGGAAYWILGFSEERPVSSLTIGKTYDVYDRFKLLKDNRWVMLIDDSDYTQQELEDAQIDNYPEEVYPSKIFIEGSYVRKGDSYYFKRLRSATVKFASVKAVDNKVIFEKKITKEEDPNFMEEPLLVKSKGKMIYRDMSTATNEEGAIEKMTEDIEVLEADEAIPSSIEAFLKAYTYKPKSKR